MFPLVLAHATVDLATPDDLNTLNGDIPDVRWRPMICDWIPVKIVSGTYQQIHILGRLDEPPYITSAVVCLDAEREGVLTKSGSIYHLLHPSQPGEMLMTTQWHLRNALVAWRLTSAEEIDGVIERDRA